MANTASTLASAAANCYDWVDVEVEGCDLGDARLERRLSAMLGLLADGLGASIPFACQDWAGAKAAYRFLSNEHVTEERILQGHFEATRARVGATRGPVLVLHDTTEFVFKRQQTAPIGMLCDSFVGAPGGRLCHRTVCGLLMHSSLAITCEGLPLGLTAAKFWTRSRFHGANALKRSINPTRVPIEQKESMRWLHNVEASTRLVGEPARCVHIGDRESDIYELFCLAGSLQTHFLVRTCVDRLALDGDTTVHAVMSSSPRRAVHRIAVFDEQGRRSSARLELKYQRIRVLPPIGKRARYPDLTLTVIHATELGTPLGRSRIEWRLLTNLPVSSRADALCMLRWYALRWKIEIFHKILKSGCRAEDARLRTAQRLTNLLAMYCVIAWRIFWLTMLDRVSPKASATLAFTALEIEVLDHAVRNESADRHTVHGCLRRLARLGGYLARNRDPPPGNAVVWRGMTRLVDMRFGWELAHSHVGN